MFMNSLKTPLQIDSSLCSVTFHEMKDLCKVLITKFSDEKELPFFVDDRYQIEATNYCKVKNNKILFNEHFAVIILKRREN